MNTQMSRRSFMQLTSLATGSIAFGLWGHDHPTTAQTAGLTATPHATISGRSALVVPGFDSFADQVKTLTDSIHLFVESNGMPAHQLMVGISSWQQQVPLPQDYSGLNAWQLPMNPVLAANPISAKTALYRGAIALAVNGVPIFNALNNRGVDSFLTGELDEFGGHSGRADDYHYHKAPLHLQTIVGPGKPIAYGLDGYPLYGLTEPDGTTAVSDLDQFNGHFGTDGHYHYHGTERYPYLNGGMCGVVSVVGDQVDPQPRTTPVRPSLQPLNGAVITDFQVKGTTSYSLAYQISGQTYYVNYSVQGSHYTFSFVDPTGKTRTESYTQSTQSQQAQPAQPPRPSPHP